MSLTRAEQEVVAVWDAEGRAWWVAATYPPMVRKLRRLAAAYGLPVEEQGPGIRVTGLPTTAVSLRAPRRARDGRSEAGSSPRVRRVDPEAVSAGGTA